MKKKKAKSEHIPTYEPITSPLLKTSIFLDSSKRKCFLRVLMVLFVVNVMIVLTWQVVQLNIEKKGRKWILVMILQGMILMTNIMNTYQFLDDPVFRNWKRKKTDCFSKLIVMIGVLGLLPFVLIVMLCKSDYEIDSNHQWANSSPNVKAIKNSKQMEQSLECMIQGHIFLGSGLPFIAVATYQLVYEQQNQSQQHPRYSSMLAVFLFIVTFIYSFLSCHYFRYKQSNKYYLMESSVVVTLLQ
ncbi:hypothetical protein RFI_16233, partial [Reticulomyxa filosa]